LIPTGSFGEPCRPPGDVVGTDVEELGVVPNELGLELGLGVGARLGVGVGTTGTGEIAEWVAARAPDDDAADAAAEAWAAAAEAAAEVWAAVDAAADPVTAELDAAAELTAAEVPGTSFRSAGFVEVLQPASAKKTAIAMATRARRAVRVRRGIPHAATPGPA